MKLLDTEIGSSGLYRAVEEYTVSSPLIPLIGTVLSRNPRILVFEGNHSSYVRATSNGSTQSTQPDW